MDPTPAGGGGPNNLPVHPLLSGSVAIDLTANGQTIDQRGYARPQDGNLDGTSLNDVGAYEMFPRQFEAERLFVTHSSGDNVEVVNDARASAGQNANLQSNAVNDFATFQTPSLPVGTYHITLRIKKTTNAGIFQLSIGSSPNSTINFGSPQDTYASSALISYVELNYGYFTVSTAGARYFKLKVTGKNVASSGYQLFPDFILLGP
jgi:hypothetical protein